MKVIYEDRVLKRIQKAVYDADVLGQRIERLDLTVEEANELSASLHPSLFLPEISDFFRHYTKADAGKAIGRCFGVRLCVEP
jgi:hypothetical protein